MTRKKIFLIPALFLCTIFSFLTFSCSSGMSDESGEVSFTFTEPMLRKVMSRDAGSGNGYNISDLMSGLEKYGLAPKNVKFKFAGTGSSLDESESPTTYPFILYLYDPDNYELYSLNLMESIAAGFGNDPSQNISGMGGGFSEIFKSALVSKGEWTSSANYIDITEKQYRTAASGNLLDVPSTTSPTSIRFLLDTITFNFDTKAGYHITFYNTGNNSDDYDSKDYSPKIRVELTSKGKTYIKESEIVQVEYAALGHARIESPDMPEGQEKTYLLLAYSDGSYKIQEFDDGKLLSIVSEGRWKMGPDEEQEPSLYIYEDGKSEEQIIPFAGDDGFKVMLNETPVWFSEEDADEELADFKYLPVSVSFKNLPRGAKAKVYAEIFANEPHGKRISLASGESSDFIIESNTVVNVRMKLIDIGYKPGEPDNPSEEKEILYSATSYISEKYSDAKEIFNGLLYFYAYDNGTYEILDDTYGSSLGTKTFASGTWEADEENDKCLHLLETEYFDFEKNKLVPEEKGGIDIDLSKGEFDYNGWSAVELHFKMSGYEEPDNPSEEELVSPGGTITAFYNGTGANGVNKDTPYQLVIFNDKEYAIYEVVNNQGKIETKGPPICFGTCKFTPGEGDMFSFDFQEKAYLKDGLYTKSSVGGNHKGNTDIHLRSASGLEFVFYLVKDIPASGTIEKDNRALLINLNYNASSLYLNQGQFTFTAKYADGSALSEKDTEDLLWDIEMLHKGKNINQIDNAGPYYEVSGNQLLLYKHIPLPSEGEYQIYVTAQLPISESDLNTITSSQTFNVYVPDRHIYDISDEYNDIRYAQSLHNVVITGDVTEDDWNWELTDESSDHILQNIFANHRNTLESLTFNGSFVSPDYTDASESPLYNESSGIKFGRRVALIFNGTAKIGDFLFYGASNIETIKFTTDESTVGKESFRDISSISNIDLTGVTTIGEYAFNGCTSLKNLYIPESVTEINNAAFYDCGLTSVEFEVTTGWQANDNGTIDDYDVTNSSRVLNDLKDNAYINFSRY